MIQKRSCSLNTKVNRPFYDMVRIRITIMKNVNIFTLYETSFENIITNLSKTYRNKTKMHEKNRTCMVYL